MYIQVMRLKDDGKSSIGTLMINGSFECFTLEDTHNEPKIYGKTRIQAGKYTIELRNAGNMTLKYSDRFDFHKGMLWLRNVDNFKYVYIHTGNDEDDTDGCLLVGSSCSARIDNQSVSGSVLAYIDIYPKIADAILRGEEVTIEII